MLSSDDPQNHNEIWLRWTDQAAFCPREEQFRVLDAHETEIVLSSKFPLVCKTGVSLVVTGDNCESGIVIACQPDQEKFIVIIQLLPSTHFPESLDHDPGVLAVDDFLTEEQERLLLEEIDNEWHGCGTNTRASAH